MTESKPITVAEKVSRAEQNAELREKAARQAAKTASDPAPVEMVKCRVLKNGDGKISTGQHVAGVGEVHFEKGEEFQATRETAEELETRGYIEIQ